MRNSILILAVAALAASCGNSNRSNGTFYLKGEASFSDIAFVQHFTADSINVIDTLNFENNAFGKSIQTKGEGEFYQIEFPGQNVLRFRAFAGDTIDLNIDVSTRPLTYSVAGNETSVKISRIHRVMTRTLPKVDSLDNVMATYRDSLPESQEAIRKVADAAFYSILTDHHEKLTAIISEDSTDLANIFAFYHVVGQAQILQPQYDLPYFYMVDNGIQASADSAHTLAKTFHGYVNEIRSQVRMAQARREASMNVKVGNLAPSISLPNPDGEMIHLKDLRGKVVLIDFWASWCVPCRQNNPHLVSLYEKYNKNGFEIFSVSLDGLSQQSVPRQEWRAAIEQDGLVWPYHVSDLKGYESEVTAFYGIEQIPFTVLIDDRGMIVALNQRGVALERKVQEALQALGS
ncbi:peroxiredoxin family protein [Phaeocystidibacter luteus]|uniref:TlpA family protein disulfide reductase n=1 Tax=Phaeocystidibacter luteus TaxID=911197 RepID=A0A6N6RMW3_9FLAO|nr:TlpA disulfide reductase family protein [Phaeocystidibacter luteus]KAB2814892.1 TlpA family protein disulfide reductase [Phaeocystidibacter luteus]